MNAPFIPDERTNECESNFTLERRIKEARKRMGEKRWAELSAEWDDPVDLQLVEGGK